MTPCSPTTSRSRLLSLLPRNPLVLKQLNPVGPRFAIRLGATHNCPRYSSSGAQLSDCHPDKLDTDTGETGLTNLLFGAAIGHGSIIASTHPKSPLRLLPCGTSTPGVVQVNPQHTGYQAKEDDSDNDVFFKEHNSGFLAIRTSLDTTIPQGENQARKEWLNRRDLTQNYDFTLGTRDKAYTVGSPLDCPKSRDIKFTRPLRTLTTSLISSRPTTTVLGTRLSRICSRTPYP